MEPTTGELLLSGIKLMLIGMTIVYLFLALLVGVIKQTSKWFQRDEPESPTQLQAPRPVPARGGLPGRQEIVAAIAAAIHQYRNR
ncbi:MAG: oxaloacetate decarboxylase subunit gamma [Methylococcaceae bacterium]|nr:oxaloacetate decarboxylase subunit gamma [Methylococcaceae bacterium]